jgi:curli biogenesis system outer membrane secretion channel CsgG
MAVCLAASASAQGITGYKQGKGSGPVKGAAGTSGSTGDSGLEHCDRPMAAMAVVEPQSEYMMALSRYNLGSPTGLIRMMIQQSNCFIVVERGQAFRNMQQERDLAGSGEMRSSSNIGKGQMVAADFILTPQVVFSEGNAGGIGGAMSMFGRHAGIAGSIVGGLQFKEAQTSMLVSDARSGIQVAAAEGSTKKADLNLGGALFGAGGGGSLGGYGNTNEGKIIAAALMDNYNKVVGVVRGDESLQRNVGSLKDEAAAGGTRKAGTVFEEGDVVGPKITGVKLYAEADDASKVVATLTRSDELLTTGDEANGFVKVEGAEAAGWVKASMLAKR